MHQPLLLYRLPQETLRGKEGLIILPHDNPWHATPLLFLRLFGIRFCFMSTLPFTVCPVHAETYRQPYTFDDADRNTIAPILEKCLTHPLQMLFKLTNRCILSFFQKYNVEKGIPTILSVPSGKPGLDSFALRGVDTFYLK